MNLALIEKIANAVLYEGYNLYPYRPSAQKNQRRWTFGRVYPEAYSLAQKEAEPCAMQSQVLVVAKSGKVETKPTLDIRVRFLQVIDREIGQLETPLAELPAGDEPKFQIVGELRLGDDIFQTWQEGIEREVRATALRLRNLPAQPYQQRFTFAASRTLEPIRQNPDKVAGVIVRRQHTLEGIVEVTAEPVGDQAFKVTLRIKNISPVAEAEHQNEQSIIPQTLASTHAILSLQNGEFVSLIDPPEPYRAMAASCENIGVWPVLVGEAGARDAMLASPIILYDYPQVAPESAGDFFDGTEIDEMLTLRVLTLTDEEKREMAQTDEHARKILERTETLPEEYFMKLHGALRGMGSLAPEELSAWDFLGENTRLESIAIGGAFYKKGDRVRLKPRGGADIFDIVLAGQTAIIEAIEQDFENNIHFAVVIEEDPGKDLGLMRQPGHRFFYTPDEVELLGGAPHE